ALPTPSILTYYDRQLEAHALPTTSCCVQWILSQPKLTFRSSGASARPYRAWPSPRPTLPCSRGPRGNAARTLCVHPPTSGKSHVNPLNSPPTIPAATPPPGEMHERASAPVAASSSNG